MKRIFFGVFLAAFILSTTASAQIVSCTDLSGQSYPIPDERQVILIPHWVELNKVVIPLQIAEEVRPQDRPKEPCDPDKLVVSPSTCEAE